MDACRSVETHVDRILSKFSAYSDTYSRSLESLIGHISTLQRELLNGPDVEQDSDLSIAAVLLWEQALKKLRDILSQMGVEHRDMHGGVSKCGREIDRNFVGDLNGVYQKAQHYESDPALKVHVNNLVAQHLLTSGLLDIAEFFAQESGANLDESKKTLYVEINAILSALQEHNLEPAVEWAKEHRDGLREIGSNLEFNLNKMKFLQLLTLGVDGQMEAVRFAKVFENFSDKQSTEIQTLMGCFLFLPKGLENSPYTYLLDPVQYLRLCETFLKDACNLLGIPVKSPLSVLLNAGTTAVPALLNIRQVMQQRQVIGVWGHNDELPIEIDLGNENRYHSIFSCPILRQQTTDKNPPMRLTCGHCISKEALQKLASNNKLKCPYCPLESLSSEAKVIYF